MNDLQKNMPYMLIFILLFLINEHLVVNYSKSARSGYYFIYNYHNYKRGDLVLVCIDDNKYTDILIKLGIIIDTNSICKFNMPMLLKKIVAVPNDRVGINRYGVFVNGNLIDNSNVFSEVRNIKLLPQTIKTILQDGQYIVLGNTKTSFDSRYFGIIKKQDIKYHALFVLGI